MARSLATLVFGALLFTFVSASPSLEPSASAAELDKKGKSDAKEAMRFYKEGNYEDAAKLFLRLSINYPDMLVFVRNLGACYYYMRRYEPALSNLRDYLHRKTDMAADDRAEVSGWIGEMERLRDQATAPSAPAVAATGSSAPPAGAEAPPTPPVPVPVPSAPSAPAVPSPTASAPAAGPAAPTAPPAATPETPASPATPAGGAPPAGTASAYPPSGQYPSQSTYPPQPPYGAPPQGQYGAPLPGPGAPPQGQFGPPPQGQPGAPPQGQYGPAPQGQYGPAPQQLGPPSAYPPAGQYPMQPATGPQYGAPGPGYAPAGYPPGYAPPTAPLGAPAPAGVAAAQAPPPQSTGSGRKVAAWLLGITGVVVAGAGGALTYLSQDKFSKVETKYDPAQEKTGKNLAIGAGVCYGAGGALLVTGIILGATGGSSSGYASLAPAVGPGLAGATLSGRF